MVAVEEPWEQTSGSVPEVHRFPLPLRLKPGHGAAGCSHTHARLSVWLLNAFSKADGKSGGEVCVDLVLLAVAVGLGRRASWCLLRS